MSRVKLSHRLVYGLARSAIALAANLPERLGYGFAALLGRLYFRCSRRRQQCALRFLRAAYPGRPDRELLRIGRIATGNICKVPIDMAKLTALLARGGDIRRVVDMAEYEAALPKKPFLGVTAHLGSWEVGAAALAHMCGQAHGVARVFKNPLLNAWILHNRRRGGLIIHPRRGGIRPLANALKQGHIGLQVTDQHQRLRGVAAPFFGRMASCERAAASLCLRGSYPVVFGAAIRQGPGFRFKMIASPTLLPVSTGDKEQDLRALVTAMNRGLEAMILQAPEQYLWIHDRYRDAKTAPVEASADDEEPIE